jgi:hypothetical protein
MVGIIEPPCKTHNFFIGKSVEDSIAGNQNEILETIRKFEVSDVRQCNHYLGIATMLFNLRMGVSEGS